MFTRKSFFEEWRRTRGQKKGGLGRTPIFYTTLFRKTHIEPGRLSVTETKTNYCNNVHFMAAERFSNDVLDRDVADRSLFQKGFRRFFQRSFNDVFEERSKIFTKKVQNFFMKSFSKTFTKGFTKRLTKSFSKCVLKVFLEKVSKSFTKSFSKIFSNVFFKISIRRSKYCPEFSIT